MGRFYREALASLNRYSSGWAGYVWCYGGGYCAVDGSGAWRTNKEQTAAPYAEAVAGRVIAQTPSRLTYVAGRGGATELSPPPGPSGWRVAVEGRAWVVPSPAGRVVVRAVPGATVTVVVNRG